MTTTQPDIQMTALSFEIPSPISLNNCYMDVVNPRTMKVRRIPTAQLLAFKTEVSWIAKSAANRQGWVYVPGMQIELHLLCYFKDRRRRDLSNRIKPAEDAIVEALGFDDSWTTITRVIAESGGIDPNPRAIVTLKAMLSINTNNQAKEQKRHVRGKSTRTNQRVGSVP